MEIVPRSFPGVEVGHPLSGERVATSRGPPISKIGVRAWGSDFLGSVQKVSARIFWPWLPAFGTADLPAAISWAENAGARDRFQWRDATRQREPK
jgi:hypothetical protein